MRKPTAKQLRRAYVEMANWANRLVERETTGTQAMLRRLEEAKAEAEALTKE